MTMHPDVERMRRAGFDVLPMLDHHGRDDGLLFWRWPSERQYLDVAAIFNDNLAVASRLPPRRDWFAPFDLTRSPLVRPTTFTSLAVELENRFRTDGGPASHPRT